MIEKAQFKQQQQQQPHYKHFGWKYKKVGSQNETNTLQKSAETRNPPETTVQDVHPTHLVPADPPVAFSAVEDVSEELEAAKAAQVAGQPHSCRGATLRTLMRIWLITWGEVIEIDSSLESGTLISPVSRSVRGGGACRRWDSALRCGPRGCSRPWSILAEKRRRGRALTADSRSSES